MKPEFERNERQKELFKKSITHLISCIVFNFICIALGAAINGEVGAVTAFFGFGFISVIWIGIAYSYYEESKKEEVKKPLIPQELEKYNKN